MDGSELSGWIVAIGTLSLVAVGEIDRRRRERRAIDEHADKEHFDAKAEVAEQLKPIMDILVKHGNYHGQHFASETSAAMEQTRLAQQINSHEKACTEHRCRMEDMFKEIRQMLRDRK